MKNRKVEPGLRLINMEDVAVEQVEWLLYPFIPYGKVTIIQGDPGEGKTTMVLQIIAKLTKGEPVLPVMDGEEEPAKKAGESVNVIYQTAEDGLGDTIKPRLLSAGADCSKVLVIGNKDDMGAKTAEGQMAARILDEYMKGFQERNPTLRVFSAHLHMDEATPHLHIDFVPYITGSKRGLDTRVSLKQALSALGFKGGTRMETELNQWVTAEKQRLASIMLEHGIEWEQKGTHEKHLSLLDFEKQERAKEVAALEKQKAELEEHNATMQEVNEKWLDQLENIEREISSAHENREEADKQVDQAKKKAAQYEKKLTEIAPMVKDMERFAEKYSADPEEILPEAGTLETGKAYREKKAKPLIKKIVTVLRSVYRAYLDLSRRFSDMQKSYERAWSKVNSLTARVEELWNENRMLRENLGDFERVKGALGRDTVETIVQAERQREQALKGQKRAQRRKMDRGAR